ncbi:MAG: hypothetical protein HUJ56_11640, partial [Erysipelotrichaceae bacterium]|nr:hypothetical protein [Erysipelotrichaceae bacterium]
MNQIYSPQYSGMGMDYAGFQNGGSYVNMQQNLIQQQPPRPMMPPPVQEPPVNITMGDTKAGGLFTIIDKDTDNSLSIPIDNTPDVVVEKRERKPRVKKEDTTSIVTSKEGPLSGTVEGVPTAYTYMETTNLLRDTLGQIDAVNAELVQEFNAIKNNRTMKNKYSVMIGLSENIGSLISNRISAIREINSSISKSNEMDYKKYKDVQAAQSAVNDEKYVADMYKAFMSNPNNQVVTPQVPQVDPSILGSGIVRATLSDNDIHGNGPVDTQYLSYLANMTPEQNLMRYETDPNVKQVLVYDASTGARFFQYMNTMTGEVISNMPVYDQSIAEETTVDTTAKIAKNINLRQTFPLVVIN